MARIQNRTMGEYSIAKSFKGILRIAHIIDTIQGDPDIFLNPTYYGTPTARLDISGSADSKQKGVDSAVYSLKGDGTIKRYISDDELKNCRVPMTDSMGNYLNWNVGSNGITIGSEQFLNDTLLCYNVFQQKQNAGIPIYQEKYFPIFQTKQILIGRNSKEHRTDNKNTIGVPLLSLVAGEKTPALIVENLYDKTNTNKETFNVYSIDGNEVQVQNYKKTSHKKLRTVFEDNCQNPREHDVIMYRQNNWGYDNYRANYVYKSQTEDPIRDEENNIWTIQDTSKLKDKFKLEESDRYDYNKNFVTDYNLGQILDCHADVENIVDYVKLVIEKYLRGNIIEVPTGTVIWQYCSLDKWRAYKDDGMGVPLGHLSPISPGNRPTLETRAESQRDDRGNDIPNTVKPFYNSVIQGACRKINRLLIREPQKTPSLDTQINDEQYITTQNDSELLEELIPLYKRDYVLCDGSIYRIPFYPNFINSNIAYKLKEHKERFFELFFNLGYRYTERENMLSRPRVKYCTTDGQYHLVNKDEKFIIPQFLYNSDLYQSDKELFASLENVTQTQRDYGVLCDNPNVPNWSGEGAPDLVKPSTYKLEDTDILFGEDFATMVAIEILYDYYKEQKLNYRIKPTYEQMITYAKSAVIPEKYIFNSYIGHRDGIKVPYTNNGTLYKINIGKEVSKLSDKILYYYNYTNSIKQLEVYKLPMVNFFLHLLCNSQFCQDGQLMKYFYTYYSFDFQVPKFLPDDFTPSFIGSGGYSENDTNRVKLKKVVQWESKFNHASVPHRHGVFAGKSILNNLNVADFSNASFSSYYKGNKISSAINSSVNIATFYGGEIQNFRGFGTRSSFKGKRGAFKTETQPNYIINQYYVQKDSIKKDRMNVTILNNNWQSLENGVFDGKKYETRDYYGYPTGGKRKFIEQPENWGNSNVSLDKPILNSDNTLPNSQHEIYSDENLINSQTTRENYFNHQKNTWYSLSAYEDPRFDTAQPNRGLTSPPIASTQTIKIDYQKIELNALGYKSNENENGKYGFFSPQHITMLPLIKL